MDESNENVSNQHENIKSVIQYILNNSVDKLPIKKSEIVSNVLGGKNKQYLQIIETVKTRLREIYGICLIEIPDSKPLAYICVTEFSSASILECTQKQRSDITLLFIILSYIFMKGTPVNEETLYLFLNRFNVKDDGTHSYLGSNLKKLINDTFVRQLYLKKEKIQLEISHEEQIVFSWGFRGTIEFPKLKIFQKICQLMGKPEVTFVQQYNEIHGNVEDVEDVEDVEMEET